MKAILKGISSPDIDDIEHYHPDTPSFGFLIQLFIGPSDDSGYESFSLMVCSPEWLKERCQVDGVVMGRHYLFMESYSYQAMIAFIEKYLSFCEGETWEEVATLIARLGKWEFEDYKNNE